MSVLSILVSASMAMLAQSTTAADAMQALAERQDDSALVAAIRQQPDSARGAITRLLALAGSKAPDSLRSTHLAAARTVARAYATAWRDSFFIRRIATFERWSPGQRAAKVTVDSLRHAGNDAAGRDGVPAAMQLWRRSLRRAVTLGDSAGQTAALGNLGAGFYRGGQLDSAAVYLTRSRDLAVAIGDHRSTGNAVGTLASVSKDRGDLKHAEELYRRASEVRVRSGDTRGMAADQNNLGLIAQRLGDLESARHAFEAALEINRRDKRATVAAVNLTNLANVASITADHPRAAVLYGEALNIYRDGGNRADAVSVLHNLGLLEMRRGAYELAHAVLVQARALADSTGAVVDAIAIRADLATVYGAMGKLQTALTTLRRAERLAAEGRLPPSVLAELAISHADLAVVLNSLPEAERQYTRAATLYRRAGDPAGQAAAQHGQGLLLLLRENHSGAVRLLTLAARTQAASGDNRSAASIRLLVGYAQAQSGDTAAARRTLTAASRSLQVLGDAVAEATALSALGDLAQDGGAVMAAESLYRQGLELLGRRRAPDVRSALHAGLGDALRSRGALGEAARELHAAVAEIERMSGTLPLAERRAAFLADKWDVYAQLALTEHARRRDSDAFAVSERMRARQMLDLVSRGRIAAATGARGSASEREQDLRHRITDLTRVLEGNGRGARPLRGPDIDARALNPTREALDIAQKTYADLLLELRESNPAHTRLASGETASWREVAARLAPDEVLLEYLMMDSVSIVFVVTRDTVEALDLDVSRRDLTRLVDFTRSMMWRPLRSRSSPLWRAPLRRLHQLLIDPIEASGYLSGKRALIIVPHGELHFLPFGALLMPGVADHFLVQRFQVTYAPSASLWVRLGARHGAQGSEGLLALAPRTDALPASRGEVATIGDIYGDRATVLIGASASEHAFRMAAPAKAIVHVATSGVLNKHNPLFSFVELAPEGDQDGRLEVHEVFGLGLTARLVVLSACQTALGSGAIADVPPGDDWVGLVQAFHYAGAANVLATLWPVEDRATAHLMGNFYRELRSGRSEAGALAEAQRAALSDPRTAHPFFWAGFVLSGSH